ncbi:MAG: TlpA family protein disulfide reductase [Chloroflexi bacterium]|nr:TlpA family protein disulfide reductase [Chloroflexota bacterium]
MTGIIGAIARPVALRGSFHRLFRSRRALLFATGLIAVAAIACGTDDSASSVRVMPADEGTLGDMGSGSTETTGATAAGTVTLQEIVDNLPFDFEVEVYQREDILGGQNLMFSEILAQGKPVVLNAWAGLCPPCRAEMPELQAVFEEFQDHMILFGLDLGPFTGLGNRDDAIKLIEEIGVTYPAGNTTEARVVTKYKILGMPSTFFIKPNGEILRNWTGALTTSKLRELVTELIAAS